MLNTPGFPAGKELQPNRSFLGRLSFLDQTLLTRTAEGSKLFRQISSRLLNYLGHTFLKVLLGMLAKESFANDENFIVQFRFHRRFQRCNLPITKPGDTNACFLPSFLPFAQIVEFTSTSGQKYLRKWYCAVAFSNTGVPSTFRSPVGTVTPIRFPVILLWTNSM